MNNTFEIKGDYIELIKLLKASGISENGAQAQELVVENQVKVNGVIETRKRAKIRRGDRVETPFGNIVVE